MAPPQVGGEAFERLRAYDPLDGAQRDDAAPAGQLRYVLLDVFTETPLAGNQLAVVTDGREISSEQMQAIARELKLSETVFALPPQAGGDIRVRIFTPSAELPFAGHPVLGSAVLLAIAAAQPEVTLETGAGQVPIASAGDGPRMRSGWMSQPIPSWRVYEHAPQLLEALGVERSQLPVEVYDNGPRHVFVELADCDAVATLRPDMGALFDLGEVCASCFARENGHWKTRMFAPAFGVNEDPATGSAAGPLALHLSRHGRIAFGEQIEIAQGAELTRPSRLFARASGEGDSVEKVEVGGSAVILAAGAFLLG